MSFISFILIAWMVHLIVVAVLVSPIVFLSRKRVQWHSWELLAVVVPFSVWMGLMVSDLSSGIKSLSNLVVEPGILGLTLALGALARVAMSDRLSDRTASRMTLLILCFGAAAVYWSVPGLRE